MLHDFTVLDVSSGHHGLQHLLLFVDPLLDTVGLGEELVEAERVEEPLLPQLGQLLELLVPLLDRGKPLGGSHLVGLTQATGLLLQDSQRYNLDTQGFQAEKTCFERSQDVYYTPSIV